MPAKAMYGAERSPYEPMGTQTSQQEAALLSTGMVTYAHEGRGDGHGPLTPPIAAGLVDFRRGGHPRGVDQELPTQTGSETMGLLSARILPMRTNGTSRDSGEPSETIVANAGSGGLSLLSTGIVPFRQNTIPQNGAEPMGTQTSECIPGVLTAAGRIQCNGDPAEGRTYPLNRPLGTVVGSAITQGLLFGGWYKQNGAMGTETAPHPMSDPYGTITGRDTTAMLMAQWQERLKDLKLEDCFFRMMSSHEIGRGCGFDVDFPGYGYQGSYLVWGSARDQVDGFGNAVSPQVGRFIGERLYKVLHEDLAS
jgi:DNA (cytosine-5)-methyltransferase 1